ncbi:ATP-grasp domain-containing protein [Fretibacter rubidus]|uniref:ATP-grasp domain-containing protein n=1 Tax=Fretibacter rubidus TaxID=570162 RepID=UPI00352AF399
MNTTQIEGKLVIVSETIGVSVYDFNFDLYFRTSHPYRFNEEKLCVLRLGAVGDYEAKYKEMLGHGLRLVNTPEEHLRATELDKWYPLIEDLTPRSMIFDLLPNSEIVEKNFDWPVFIKGSRQTSKHSAALSIAKNRIQYEKIKAYYRQDEILHWQKPVIREFVPLKKVAGVVPHQVPTSLEYRSFWWNGNCVGCGRYWYQVPMYSTPDLNKGLELAREAAKRVDVPFLVIDFAKTNDGQWIVIECNDGQESGYTDIIPQILWADVLAKL